MAQGELRLHAHSSLVSTVAVCVWDSQVRDGSTRSPEKGRGTGTAWQSQEAASVVQELLRNSSDKAYGKQGNVPALGWWPCAGGSPGAECTRPRLQGNDMAPLRYGAGA